MLNKYRYNGIIFFNKEFPSRKIIVGEELSKGVFKVTNDDNLKIIYENNLLNNWVMINPYYEAILLDSDLFPIENNMILSLSNHSNKRNHNTVVINFILNKIYYYRNANNINDLFIQRKEDDDNKKFIMHFYMFQSQKYIMETIYKELINIGYDCKIVNNYNLYNKNSRKVFKELYKNVMKSIEGINNTIWKIFDFINNNRNIQSIDIYETNNLEKIYKESGNKISNILINKIIELINSMDFYRKTLVFDDKILYDSFIYYGQDLKKYNKCNNILLVHISSNICIGLVFINKPKEKYEFMNIIQEALDTNAVSKEEIESMLSLIS